MKGELVSLEFLFKRQFLPLLGGLLYFSSQPMFYTSLFICALPLLSMASVLEQMHGIWMGTVSIPIPLFIAYFLALHAFWRLQQLSYEQAIKNARLTRRKRPLRKRPLRKRLNIPLQRARQPTPQTPLAEQSAKILSDCLPGVYPTPEGKKLLPDVIAELPNLIDADLRALAAAASLAASQRDPDNLLVSNCSAFKPVTMDPIVDPKQHTYRPTPIGSGPGQQAAEPFGFEQPNVCIDGDQLAQQVVEGVIKKILPDLDESDVWQSENLNMPAMNGLSQEQQYYQYYQQQYYWHYQQQQQKQQQQRYKQFPDYTQPALDNFDSLKRHQQMYHDLYRADVAQLVSKLSDIKQTTIPATPKPALQSANCQPTNWPSIAQPAPQNHMYVCKPHNKTVSSVLPFIPSCQNF